MPARKDNQILLPVGPIAGLDTTTSPYFVDQNHATVLTNFVPNRDYQALDTVLGRVNALLSNIPLTKILQLTKFYTPGSAAFYLAVGFDAVTRFRVYKFTLGAAPTLVFSFAAGTISTTATAASLVQYQNYVFITIVDPTQVGVLQTIKIDQTATSTNWQFAAAGTPSVATGAAGLLNGDYYYRFTFSNSVQESGASGISAKVSPANQHVTVSGLPTNADPQVTTCNIYRLGGTLSQWLEVGSVSNGTATFDDNTSDANVGNLSPTGNSGQTLVIHRDVPPAFQATEVFQERIWGWYYAGTSTGSVTGNVLNQSSLWYSNYSEPTGFDNVNQVIPIGVNPAGQTLVGTIANVSAGDVGIGLATVGGMLVAFKQKTTWAVTGTDQADFIANKLFDVGCIAKLSVTKAAGLVFWLSEQGAFSFDGANAPNYLSKQIKKTLESYSTADLQAASGFYEDQVWYLSFPTKGVTFGYFLQAQEWHEIGWATDCAYFDPENLGEVTASNPSTPGEIDSWFAASTDLGGLITATCTSKIEDNGDPASAKRYRYIEVNAPVQVGGVSIILQCNPGAVNAPAPFVLGVDLSLGPRQMFSVPPSQVGTQAQLTLSVNQVTSASIQTVRLYGSQKRSFVLAGG